MSRYVHRLNNDQTWDIVSRFDSAFTAEAAKAKAVAVYGPYITIVDKLRQFAQRGYLQATLSKSDDGGSVLLYSVIPGSTYTKNITKLGRNRR